MRYVIPANTHLSIARDDHRRAWKAYTTKLPQEFDSYRSKVGDVYTFDRDGWLMLVKMRPRDATTMVPRPIR